MPYTLVSFHAHPDDEALLTAGTLARAAAEGHRVVLVVATVGRGRPRRVRSIAARSARTGWPNSTARPHALGVARVV